MSEGWYSGDPAGSWSRTLVTVCVPGASCWRAECLYLAQNSCVGCACVFDSKPSAVPASKQDILGLVLGGDSVQGGVYA